MNLFKNPTSTLMNLVHLLAITNVIIKKYGYISKKQEVQSNTTSTASRMFTLINDSQTLKALYNEVTEDDKNIAKNIIIWAQDIKDDSNDYLFSIKSIALSEEVSMRQLGFATSMIEAYKRDREQNVNASISKYVGTIGARQRFELSLVKHTGFDSMYGYTHIFIFEDKEKNTLIWRTSKEENLIEGQQYTIDANVKEHSEYKNRKQTIITRCKIK